MLLLPGNTGNNKKVNNIYIYTLSSHPIPFPSSNHQPTTHETESVSNNPLQLAH